jgi:ribosomal protein S17E
MRKILTTTGVALALAVPAFAQADDTSPTTAKTTAEKLCRAERGTTDATKAAFAQKYGTNKNKKNAFGKCVSKTTAIQKQQDDTAAEDATEVKAAKTCSTERGTTAESLAAFTQKYGTNKNKSNAFGKCVSKTVAAQRDTTDDGSQADGHGNGNGKGRS